MNEQVQVRVTDPNTQLRANVYETPGGDSYVIEIPVPGVKPDEISIEVTVDTVTVRTEPRQQQDESERKYVKREHSVESMSRVFEFPRELDTDNVRATLEIGILKVRVRKAIAARPKVIGVEQAA